MKIKFMEKLGVKVAILTLLLASMTLLSSAVGIISLADLKQEYQQLKEENFDALVAVHELKSQTDAIIHLSTEMLLSRNKSELPWALLEISDRKIWIDKLFSQLKEHTTDHQALVVLKQDLYDHLQEIADAMSDQFHYADLFFTTYRLAEAYKRESLLNENMKLYLILDKSISYFKPELLVLRSDDNTEALEVYLNKALPTLDKENAQRIENIFLGEKSFSAHYKNYLKQSVYLDELRLKNEEVTDLFVSFMGENVTFIQDKFTTRFVLIDNEIKKRKRRLYAVALSCAVFAIFLLLLQLDLIHRIEIIRKLIVSADRTKIMNYPIKRKDEISRMALTVKNYVASLIAKENEVLASNKKLEHLASHDALTSIFNRRYFETLLTQENTRYLRYKEVYCVAMVDLDFFKKVNDNYGHDAGDKILVEFVRRVLLVIRDTDVFARFGGEEFVLLLPNTVEKNAHILMERIRAVVDENPYNYNGQEIIFTVSIGLTEVQRSVGDDALKQVSFADKALYEAKHAGRNQVCIYNNTNDIK